MPQPSPRSILQRPLGSGRSREYLQRGQCSRRAPLIVPGYFRFLVATMGGSCQGFHPAFHVPYRLIEREGPFVSGQAIGPQGVVPVRGS